MRRAESGTEGEKIGSPVIIQASCNVVATEALGSVTTHGIVAADKAHFRIGDILASRASPSEHVVDAGELLPPLCFW